MPPTNAQAHPAADPTLFEPQAAWRMGPGVAQFAQGPQSLQQPPQQTGWPPGGGAPPLPADVQQQLAQWYWWTQYASFCQGAASAAASGQSMPFVAASRPAEPTPGYPQQAAMGGFFPFPMHGMAACGSASGDGSTGGVSRPVAVRAFSGMHASAITQLPLQGREEPSRKRSELPTRGRRRRTTPEDRCCINCETTQTPFWRKHKSGGALCNACGLYMAKNDAPRPRLLWTSRDGAGAAAGALSSDAQPGTSGSQGETSEGMDRDEGSPRAVVTPDGRTPEAASEQGEQARSA